MSNGYIKIELGAQDRGLKFNQLALEIMGGYAGETTTQNVYAMFYGGLRGNSFVKREEPDYTFEDVCDWVDEIYAAKNYELIKNVEEVLTQTQLYKSLVPEKKAETKGEPKKKK